MSQKEGLSEHEFWLLGELAAAGELACNAAFEEHELRVFTERYITPWAEGLQKRQDAYIDKLNRETP